MFTCKWVEKEEHHPPSSSRIIIIGWQSLGEILLLLIIIIAMIPYQSLKLDISNIQHCVTRVCWFWHGSVSALFIGILPTEGNHYDKTQCSSANTTQVVHCGVELGSRVKTEDIVSHNTGTLPQWPADKLTECWPNRPHPPPPQSKKPTVDTISHQAAAPVQCLVAGHDAP